MRSGVARYLRHVGSPLRVGHGDNGIDTGRCLHHVNRPVPSNEGVGDFTHPGQMSRLRKAKAVAAEREDTSSLSKMLLRWRSTVRLLSANSRAIALFGWPAAMWRSTSSSRWVSPC